MKRLFLIIGVLLCASSAHAQWPYIPVIQSIANTSNVSTVACTFNRPVTTGDLVVVGVNWAGTTNQPSLVDTFSSSITQNFVDTAVASPISFYSFTLGSSGTETITSTVTSGDQQNISCAEFPPFWTLTKDCATDAAYSGSPSTVTTPGCTTSQNGDLVFTYTKATGGQNINGMQPSAYGVWHVLGSNNISAGAGLLSFRVGDVAGSTHSITLYNISTGSGTTMTIAFKSKAISITSPAAAPDGGVGVSYAYTLLANGGVGAYTWSITSGSLPLGLSLNTSTGAITGTPLASNNYSATFQVTDGTNTTTEAVTFKIATVLDTISLVQSKSSTSTTSGDSGITFSTNVTAGDTLFAASGYVLLYGYIYDCTDSLNTPFRLIGDWSMNASNLGTAGMQANSIEMFAGVAPSSGADTIACGTNNLRAIAEVSHAGFVTSDNGAVTNGNTASPATITSSSFTPLVPNEILFGVCDGFTSATSTNAMNSPFTVFGTNTINSVTGYQIISTVTGYTLGCNQAGNTNGSWLIGLAGLRPSGGTVVPPVSSYGHKTVIF